MISTKEMTFGSVRGVVDVGRRNGDGNTLDLDGSYSFVGVQQVMSNF